MISQAPKLGGVRQGVISQALLCNVIYEYSMGFSNVGCVSVVGDADYPFKSVQPTKTGELSLLLYEYLFSGGWSTRRTHSDADPALVYDVPTSRVESVPPHDTPTSPQARREQQKLAVITELVRHNDVPTKRVELVPPHDTPTGKPTLP